MTSQPDTACAAALHALREYAFVADGERGALIGPRGDYAWLCAPNWDSPAVFSSLIGGASNYAVTPTGRYVWGGYYEPGTLIWRSRWGVGTAIVECREALVFPGDPHRAVVLRQIHGVRGDAQLNVCLQPVGEFGHRHLNRLQRIANDCWIGRVGALRMRWSGAPKASVFGDTPADRRLVTTISVSAGDQCDLVLELSDIELPTATVDAADAWERTESAWREAMPRLGPMAARRDASHAYAVMRGMATSSGGMIAAATTSLPEAAEDGTSYDYRYVWIRDLCFAGQAVAADGPHPLLDGAVEFVAQRLLDDGPEVRPAYTPTGGAVPPQTQLDLPGYPGGNDIVGNRVRGQFQLDVFGEALLLFAAAARHERLSHEHQRAVDVAVAAIEQNLQRPDSGIWELTEKTWAHSRLICAAGLRAAAACGPAGGDVSRMSALADGVIADVSASCLHPSGRWQRAPDDPRVDAALLLPALRGALPADDPRSVATYRAVRQELSRDFYVYRFWPKGGVEPTDSSFLLCGFVMAMAALQQRDDYEALRFFERNRATYGPPGIYSEEYDIEQRQMRGNLPQAFVHAAMFESSSRLGQISITEGNAT
jgi:alpha,alpha-trehalase